MFPFPTLGAGARCPLNAGAVASAGRGGDDRRQRGEPWTHRAFASFRALANRMPVNTSPEPSRRLRLALLLVAVALIVVVPASLLRTAAIDSMQAMEQVNHSQQVEAQSYALT